MSLKVTEQLQILRGGDGDPKPPSNLLIDVVTQIAWKHAIWMYDNQKSTTNNQDAASYQQKMNALANQILNGNVGQGQNLKKAFVAVVGDQYTWAQVQAADDDAWAGAVEAVINKCFELVSGTTKIEKDDYDSL